MGEAPPVNFRTHDLLDAERFRNGPMAVYWGQEEIVECNRSIPDPPTPRRRLMDRIFRRRPWRIDVRLVPPSDRKLNEWMREVSTAVGLSIGEPQEGDRAAWLVAAGNYRNPAEALGATGRLLNGLTNLRISAAQIVVVAMPKESHD